MNLQPFIDAIVAHQWAVLGALFVGGVVALAKQGWLSSWLASHLPSGAIPYVAPLLGALGLAAAEVQAGKPLAQALLDGIGAGILAVFGHEAVIEGLRGGKEIIPLAPWHQPPSSGGTTVDAHEVTKPPPPPPVAATVSAFGVISVLLTILACTPTEQSAIIHNGEQIGACVIGQVVKGGITDPLQIVAACAGTVVQDVINIIEAFLKQSPADGGMLSTEQIARLQRALGSAKAALSKVDAGKD